MSGGPTAVKRRKGIKRRVEKLLHDGNDSRKRTGVRHAIFGSQLTAHNKASTKQKRSCCMMATTAAENEQVHHAIFT